MLNLLIYINRLLTTTNWRVHIIHMTLEIFILLAYLQNILLIRGSKQYEFIKNDLDKTSTNSEIVWIVVHQHKPLYSTNQDKVEAKQLRNTYQLLFQQYGVDLVISSHNQYYEGHTLWFITTNTKKQQIRKENHSQ